MRPAQPQKTSPNRIFISYRREESDYPAGWLFDRLHVHFPGAVVFKDVDSIEPGDDFVEVITSAVGSCDVLLALIGERWLTVTDDDGRRRLDDPDDFIRVEIETALARQVRVIPVLLYGARMPRAQDLPASLSGLVRRQALELSATRFDSDVGRLLRALDKAIAEVRNTPRPEKKPDPVQRDVPPVPAAPPRWRFGTTQQRIAIAAVVSLVVVTTGIWLWIAGKGGAGPPGDGGSRPPAQSGGQAATWQPLQVPRGGAGDEPAAAAFHGEIWLAGGSGSAVRVYNPQSGQWADAAHGLPAALSHGSLVTDGQRLYFIGGLDGATRSSVSTVYRLDAPGGSWTPDTALPKPLYSGAAAWDGKRIVFAGGTAGEKPRKAFSDMWALVPGDSSWTPIGGGLPTPREHLAAASNGNGSVWFFGGSDVSTGKTSSEVDKVTGVQVTQGKPMPAGLQALAAAWTMQSGPCAIGGSMTQPTAKPQPVNTVWCPDNNHYPQLPRQSSRLAAAVLASDIYVIAANQMYRLSVSP